MNATGGLGAWARGVARDPGPAVGLILLAAVALLTRDANIQNTITLAMVWSFWALSLNIIWGYAGQFSMAQVALGGVSAYTSTLLTIDAGWPILASIATGTVATVVVSLVVGVASLRLADFGFAIMTLAFALAGVGLASGLEITGRSAGLIVPDAWLVLHIGPLTWDWNDRNGGFSVLLIVAFLIAVIGTKLLLRAKTGKSMLAMREDVLLAQSLGIDPRRTRLVAFAISGFVASFAGVFQAHYYSYVYPTLFDFTTLVNVIVVLVLGGRGRLFGPLIGGIIYASLTNILHIGGDFEATVLGAAVILLTIFARHGVAYYIWRGQFALVSRLRRGGRPSAAGVRATSVEEADAEGQTPTTIASVVRHESTAPHRSESAPVLLAGAGLTKRFGGVAALDDFSFSIREGEIVGLIGPNGAGKTTAFNVLSGFHRPDAGTLHWRGHDITKMSPHRRAAAGLVRTFQQPRSFKELTVRRNLEIAAEENRGRGGLVVAQLADTPEGILAKFAMESLIDVRASDLAYGDAKRLGVVLAIASGADMLLLDEPAAGLNSTDVARLTEDILTLRAAGCTIWLVEHHMEIVMEVCDRIIVLDAGRVIASGLPDDVMSDPVVMSAYLGVTVE